MLLAHAEARHVWSERVKDLAMLWERVLERCGFNTSQCESSSAGLASCSEGCWEGKAEAFLY